MSAPSIIKSTVTASLLIALTACTPKSEQPMSDIGRESEPTSVSRQLPDVTGAPMGPDCRSIQLTADAATGIDIPRDADRVRHFIMLPSNWIAPGESVTIEHSRFRISLPLDSLSQLDDKRRFKPIIRKCENSSDAWIAISHIRIEERTDTAANVKDRRIAEATGYLFTRKRLHSTR